MGVKFIDKHINKKTSILISLTHAVVQVINFNLIEQGFYHLAKYMTRLYCYKRVCDSETHGGSEEVATAVISFLKFPQSDQ